MVQWAAPDRPLHGSLGLYDYANKEWAGLVKDYHRERYLLFAQHRAAAMGKGAPFDLAAFQGALLGQACKFQHDVGGGGGGGGGGGAGSARYPAAPVGDAVAISRELWRKYAPAPKAHV